ncbi:MAG: class I SAM-dependent methyltransferase [Candidatus Margulisbacteria bacterium]|nr:class I SAM-dependent methyltransferase [Candidatus Margulisiibacteriota bacterium]
MKHCRICKGNFKSELQVKEMMFGSGKEFTYQQCEHCGCLQIKQYPEDISGFYSDQYYSLQPLEFSRRSRFKQFIRRQFTKYYLYGLNPLGYVMFKLLKWPAPFYIKWFQEAGVNLKSRILDAGCGAGYLLLSMYKDGFRHLAGADPFINEEITYDRNLIIYKKSLEEMHGKFDFIMMNHSFEHMQEQEMILRQVYRLLRPNSYLMIRIPVADSYAFRAYGANWVQLDAPRHFYLHTVKSINILAEKTGFIVKKIDYDSNEFQFWGSEQYIRNIALRSEKSFAVNPEMSIFTQDELQAYKAKALVLNKKQEGDSACFYLYKKDNNDRRH